MDASSSSSESDSANSSHAYQTMAIHQEQAKSDTTTATEPPATITPFRKFAYGVGHVFNDLSISMWFTYLVLFYHRVILLSSTNAGILVLVGQVADAAATPCVGFICDRINVLYGRRKLCHLVGTIMVALSSFFIWYPCLFCNDSTPDGVEVFYFAIPIIVFHIGWAAVQISHLSLIIVLTSDKNERVGLNTIR